MALSGDIFIQPDRLDWDRRDKRKVSEGGSLLGEGTFGSVFRGEYDGDPVAIKVIKAPRPEEGAAVTAAFRAAELQHNREIKRLVKLRFRHIVQFYGVSRAPGTNDLLIVTECLEGGSLFHALESARAADASLDDESFLRMASHVAKGLLFLHNSGFNHGDLKPMNVLVTGDAVVDPANCIASFPKHVDAKIADFGMSKRLQCEPSADGTGASSFLTSSAEFGKGPCGSRFPSSFFPCHGFPGIIISST
jgi:serine/threonine protein kinase